MDVSYSRLCVYNHFTVHLQHVLENAVGSRVRGAKVQVRIFFFFLYDWCYRFVRFNHRPNIKSFLSSRVWYCNGYSFRMGKMSISSTFKILFRLGCPSNITPKKSYVSRSIQFAPAKTVVSVFTSGLSLGKNTFNLKRWFVTMLWS